MKQWRAVSISLDTRVQIKDSDNKTIAELPINHETEHSKAMDNARLMACAPELLMELIDMGNLLEAYIQPLFDENTLLGSEIKTRIQFAKEIINKAKGEV